MMENPHPTLSLAVFKVAPMDKYIAYYRVSTKKQGSSGLGLDAQMEIVRKHMGEVPFEEFTEVESGRKCSRPELAAAIIACKKQKCTLVVAKLDRLARNAQFLLEIQSGGIDILFCDLPQISGPMGKFVVTIMAAVAELESGLVSERTTAALKQAKKNGVKLGTTGKDRARENKDKAQEHAEKVRPFILEAQKAGFQSYSRIAEYLHSYNIKCSHGSNIWYASTVKRVMERLNT